MCFAKRGQLSKPCSRATTSWASARPGFAPDKLWIRKLCQDAGDPESLGRFKKTIRASGKLADPELSGAKPGLADAQLVVAREHGFESWPRFAKHIRELMDERSPVSRFEIGSGRSGDRRRGQT